MDILNNIKNIKFINKINKLHFNEIELPFSEYVKQYDSYKLYKIKKHSLSQHFFYNMFSVIFYSIYHTIESNKTERQMFGLLNNCYRLLVTGTDNILDKDNNHYIQHNKLKNSPVIESIIDIKLAEKIISQVLIDYGIKTDNINLDKFTEFQKKIFNTFSIVGYNEAEEIQKKQVYYKPEKILSEVHHIKSGKLFTLPFLIPKLYYSKDKNKINILTELEKGIYSFGIGIQILDDLLDIEEDFSDNKPNYFISLFY